MLTVEDRLDILQVLNLYGHIIDLREWERMEELFTEDAVFDSTDLGNRTPTASLHDLRENWKVSRNHPLAHHATNIVVWEDPDGTVRTQSKGIGVGFKGRVGTLTYRDVMRRTPAGWRIARRTAIMMRPQPRPG
jgi:hypothetical protein